MNDKVVKVIEQKRFITAISEERRKVDHQSSGIMGAKVKKKEGNPREKWIDCVQKDMGNYGFQLEDAEDRDKWRTTIKGE